MSEWKPISEAPRDGTWLLLCGGETTENPSDVNQKDLKRMVVGRISDRKYFNDDDQEVETWAICNWDSEWRTSFIYPTHFQHLPKPPMKRNVGMRLGRYFLNMVLNIRTHLCSSPSPQYSTKSRRMRGSDDS